VTKSILICGVGGQGILLAGDIIAQTALETGFDVKKSEVHGMSQRGGSVISGVRFGEKVYSPLIGKGDADIILAFEKLEALRVIEYLRPQGLYIVNDYEFPTLKISMGVEEYPKGIIGELKKAAPKVILVDGLGLAKQAGNVKAANVVLLGALGKSLDLPKKSWFSVIEQRVPPKTRQANKRAFLLGYSSI